MKIEAKTLIGYTLRHFADHCIPECASTKQGQVKWHNTNLLHMDWDARPNLCCP